MVFEFGRNFSRFKVDGKDSFFALGGDHDLLDDVVGDGGVRGDHHDENTTLCDGFDDGLGPEGGGVDVALIDPDGDADGAQPIDQRHNLLIILTGITYKDLGAHKFGLIKRGIMQNGGEKSKERITVNGSRWKL